MSDDFYEDDEPVEKIRDTFARGEKGVTRRIPLGDFEGHGFTFTGNYLEVDENAMPYVTFKDGVVTITNCRFGTVAGPATGQPED